MQTILVHSRNPLRFFKELGAMNFLAFHMLLTTIVISVLIHPIFIALTVHQFGNYSGSSTGEFDAFILGLSIFNLVGGYTTYIMLAYVVLNTGKFQLGKSMLLLTLPVYWVLISIAGWRALTHIIVKPHEWEKTPHGLANRQFSPISDE